VNHEREETPMSTVPTFTFEVVPVDGASFDPFVIDVPSLSGEGFAARRAYWSAFYLLGPRGIEPEEFAVNEFDYDTATAGRGVGPGGFEEVAA
jgi:hypothetical protein